MKTKAQVDWNIVTEAEFDAYEDVRVSGVTNMWHVELVSNLSGLDHDTVLAIMSHYEDLDRKFPGIRRN